MNKEIFKKLVFDSLIMFELGAAEGGDTVELADIFQGTPYRIYCFEPDPRNIRDFEKIITDKRISLFKGVVGEYDGEVEFYQSTRNPVTKEELIYSGSIRKPTKTLFNIWPQFSEKTFDKIFVPSIRLDTFVEANKIDKIDLVLADCQGCEDIIIKGGRNTFDNKIKYFYTEYSNNEIYEGEPNLADILQLLPSYDILDIWPNQFVGDNRGGDVLLVNRNITR